MLLLQRNFILKEKTLPVAPQIQEAANLRIANCFGFYEMDVSKMVF